MKINELTKAPLSQFRRDVDQDSEYGGALPYPDQIDIEFALNKHGFTKIGNGSFATVYSHSNLDYVLKIFVDDDDGYKTFLEYAMMNKSSVHMPKFRGKPMQLMPGLMAIRMEKLEPTNGMPSLKGYFYNLYTAYKRGRGPTPVIPAGLPPTLSKTLKELAKFAVKEVVRPDLNVMNLMMRGSDIVVTDPFI